MESPHLYPVKLYVYDLSKGLARRLSPIMLGEGTGQRADGEESGPRRNGARAGRGRRCWDLGHGGKGEKVGV